MRPPHNFDPTDIPGLLAQYDARLDKLTECTQPPLVDGDMQAVGTAAWGVYDSTLSKITPGAVGTQALRVTSTGNTFWATQDSIFIVGNYYTITGYARGDGTAVPTVLYPLAAAWTGTSSATWQAISGGDTAGTDKLWLGSTHAHPGVVDFDEIVLTNDSKRIWTPTAGSLGGNLAQATAVQQPWWDGTGVRSEGDVMASSLAATAWNPLHTVGTLFWVWIPRLVGVDRDSVVTSNGVSDSGIYIQQRSTNAVRMYLGKAGGWLCNVTTNNATLALDTPAIFASRVSATDLDVWLNGGAVANATPSATPGGDAQFPLSLGYVGGSTDQTHLGLVAYNRALSDSEVARVGKYLAAKYGGSWT